MTRPSTPDPAPGSSAERRLNEHFICRAAGLPVSALDRLRARRSLQARREVQELDRRIDGLAPALVDALFQRVDGEKDRGIRRSLLRLKRDVHNRRHVRETDLAKTADSLGPEVRDRLQTYGRLWAERREAEEAARAIYAEEQVEIRRRFREGIVHPDFARGLLLSSRGLSAQVDRYLASPLKRPGSKARQIERSLMRYFSRTVMKATPFSTLCNLLPGKLRSGVKTPTFDGPPDAKVGRLRLNKTLYAMILPHLLTRSEVRRGIDLELNPTLRREDDRLLFLTARRSQEIFQRMPQNPVVELLAGTVEEHGTRTWQEAVDELCRHPEVEASPEQAGAYVDRLIELGLLRFRLGISDQEVDWDRPLAALLENTDDDVARRILEFLQTLREVVDAYPEADLEGRRALLARGESAVRDLLEELAPGRPAADAPPFYEDSGGTARLDMDFGPLEASLTRYVELTSRLAWPRSEQAGMRRFFDTYYEDSGASVPLLRFYEDYYREHFKEHLRRQENRHLPPQQPRSADGEAADVEETGGEDSPSPTPYSIFNPFGLDFLEDLDSSHRALTRRLQEIWQGDPEAEEIVLEDADVAGAVASLPPLEAGPLSVSFFVQYVHNFRPDGSPALVARTYLSGFGKYFSRFLYLLPDEVAEDLRQTNRSFDGPELAEICGDANFNANLHPPLLDHELSYPTGESGDAINQVPGSDLRVEPDPASPHRLRLVRASSGRPVVPVDLGFLNPRLRPPLFQLLSRFSPILNFNLPLPDTPHAMRDDTLDGVRYRPRITFDRRLVLARRQWQISGNAFPLPRGDEDPADFFFRLQDWRRSLGLPSEVFLRIKTLPGKEDPAERKPQREHLYKPQYVDFENPLLVDLLIRTVENLGAYLLTFEERLPAHEHLVGYGDERFATELILQLDLPGAIKP